MSFTPLRRQPPSSRENADRAAELSERERAAARKEEELARREARVAKAEADLRAPGTVEVKFTDDGPPLTSKYLSPSERYPQQTEAQIKAAADAIILAGKMRRGEVELELPTDPTARAIVEAGMRRRGEIE
ncbi:MAG: hypothetical protein ACLP19_05860 [Xanthobacteraceae bacterium]